MVAQFFRFVQTCVLSCCGFFILTERQGDMRSSSLPTNAFTAVHASKFLHMGVCVCHLGLTLFLLVRLPTSVDQRPPTSATKATKSCPTTVTNELCVSRILPLPCSLAGNSTLVTCALPGTPIWL